MIKNFSQFSINEGWKENLLISISLLLSTPSFSKSDYDKVDKIENSYNYSKDFWAACFQLCEDLKSPKMSIEERASLLEAQMYFQSKRDGESPKRVSDKGIVVVKIISEKVSNLTNDQIQDLINRGSYGHVSGSSFGVNEGMVQKPSFDHLLDIEGFELISGPTEGKIPWHIAFDGKPSGHGNRWDACKFEFKYKGFLFEVSINRGVTRNKAIDIFIHDQVNKMVIFRYSKYKDEDFQSIFNREFIEKDLGSWIVEYKRFNSHFSEGHIDDLLIDNDFNNIVKTLSPSRMNGDGWVDTLVWDISMYLKYDSFDVGQISLLIDFIKRMESFGFNCKNRLSGVDDKSGHGFYLSASKKLF